MLKALFGLVLCTCVGCAPIIAGAIVEDEMKRSARIEAKEVAEKHDREMEQLRMENQRLQEQLDESSD